MKARLKKLGRVCVAFSGGVDSSLLALAAFQALGDKALAVTADTEFVSRDALGRARDMAAFIGLPHEVVRVPLLDTVPALGMNPPERCYLCKKAVLGRMPGPNVAEGTNADDDPARPGRRAVAELGVMSPLEDAGLGKEDIRALAARLGLPNASLPSDSCLATRLAANSPVTPGLLMHVEKMERLVHSLGALTLRARPRGQKLVLEMPGNARRAVEPHSRRIEDAARNLGYSRTVFRYFS